MIRICNVYKKCKSIWLLSRFQSRMWISWRASMACGDIACNLCKMKISNINACFRLRDGLEWEWAGRTACDTLIYMVFGISGANKCMVSKDAVGAFLLWFLIKHCFAWPLLFYRNGNLLQVTSSFQLDHPLCHILFVWHNMIVPFIGTNSWFDLPISVC